MNIAPVFHPQRSKYLVFTADYLLPLFICCGLIILAYFILYSPFFRLQTITCTLDSEPCKDPSVLSELAKLQGQNIFTLTTLPLTTKLTSGDFTIRQAEASKELPSTLNIALQSVYPVVALQLSGDSSWAVFDSQFRLIKTLAKSPNVPVVVVPGPLTLTVGKPPDDQLLIQTFSLALRLHSELFSLRSLTLIDANTLQLTLSDGRLALLTPQKDELVQLRALQAVLSDATISEGVKTIDVRFNQPVLR